MSVSVSSAVMASVMVVRLTGVFAICVVCIDETIARAT